MGTGVLLYHDVIARSAVAIPSLIAGSRSPRRFGRIAPECIITQIIPVSTMKTVLNILAILLLFTGGIFFLQGINVLPGSFMTGDPQWAINGGVMIAVALGLGYLANRRR